MILSYFEVQIPIRLRISIVIVNYNSWPDVMNQVRRLMVAPSFISRQIDIVVVDNNSTHPAPADRPVSEGLHWTDLKLNGGFSAGVNEGVRSSNGDWILVLNPDAELQENTIEEVVHLADKYDAINQKVESNKTGIIGVKLINPDGTVQPSAGVFPALSRILLEIFLPGNRRRYRTGNLNEPAVVDWVTGAFFLMNRKAFEEVGGFCEDYFLYFEETDFCCRARSAGWLTVYDPGISVCHLNPLQNRTTTPYTRVITRHSRMLYFKRNRPALESFMMNIAISGESMVRQIIARIKYNPELISAWKTIRNMAVGFLKQHPVTGMRVNEAALKINDVTLKQETENK